MSKLMLVLLICRIPHAPIPQAWAKMRIIFDAPGFGCSQVVDSITDNLSRRCEPPVVLAAIFGALCQEQFSGGVVAKDIP
jgi:hypothetical protein